MKKQFIQAVDIAVDDQGFLGVRTGLEGKGKPDILKWNAGNGFYSNPNSGVVSHDSSSVFIRVGAGGAYVSIDDAPGSEKPYVVPPNYWREIAVPGGIPAGARIVAKNFLNDISFTDLLVEVR